MWKAVNKTVEREAEFYRVWRRLRERKVKDDLIVSYLYDNWVMMPLTHVGNRQTTFHYTGFEFMLEHLYLYVLWKK